MPSLEEAIDEKYGGDSFDCNSSSVTIYLPKHNPRKIVPSLLVLNDCNIDTAGTCNLSRKCTDVVELDLAQNKLTEWSEVLSILYAMPRLKFANLSFNNLSKEVVDLKPNSFEDLTNLVLNSTHITWNTVQKFLKVLPNLEELHLSFNDFHTIGLCENCLVKQSKHDKKLVKHNGVKRLHFTGNPVSTWREITKLGESFPSLESLVIAECPIKSLDPCDGVVEDINLHNGDEEEDARKMSDSNYKRSESECEACQQKISAHHWFRRLKFLNLNYTLIGSWDDVDRLGKFPELQCLRIQGCPLFESYQYTEHERRQLLIARLGNVRTLNGGGVIGDEEREDAERAFIRHYMEKPESDRPERYTDLVGIHGKLEPLVNIDLSPEKHVTVTVSCKEISEQRCLDVYQTVADLKQKFDGFAGIPSRKMRLFYLDQDMKGVTGPEEMRFPNKQLYSYNISNGDEIIVDSKLGTCKSVP
ncbi:hypothetical protein RUM43_011663 [Polyplax serrata]|uniref:Ubiquitin-like domain-containing protein n=1 Tax=Polyplax serrata TaxID=468196 RepID=A0AAN8P987_POLSC